MQKFSLLGLLVCLLTQVNATYREIANASAQWLNHVVSPDGRYIATSDVTGIQIYETQSNQLAYILPKEASLFSFNEENTRLYFQESEATFSYLDLKTGAVVEMIPAKGIRNIYQNTKQPDQIVFTASRDYGQSAAVYRHDLGSDAAPKLLATFEPTEGVQVENDQFLYDATSNKLLHYADETGKADSYGDRKHLFGRFSEIDLSNGSTRPLAKVTIESTLRWSSGAPGKVEVADGAYRLLDPYTGKDALNLKVPDVHFELDKNPMVVFAKRTDSSSGQAVHFYDILESGSLKTLHNFQVPTDWDFEEFYPRAPYDSKTQTQWFRLDADLIQIDFKTAKVIRKISLPFNFFELSALDSGQVFILNNTSWGEPKELYQLQEQDQLSKIDALEERTPAQFTDYAFHPSAPEFYATDNDENVHFFQVTRAGLVHQFRGVGGSRLQYTKDGSQLGYTSDYGEYRAVKSADRFPQGGEISYQGSRQMSSMVPIYKNEYTFSNSGKWLISSDSAGSYLHKTGAPTIVSELGDGRHAMEFSSDDTRIACLGVEAVWSEAEQSRVYAPTLMLFKVDPAEEFLPVATSVTLPHEHFSFLGLAPDDASVRLLDQQSGQILAYTTSDFTVAPAVVAKVDLLDSASDAKVHTLYDTANHLSAFAIEKQLYVIAPNGKLTQFSAENRIESIHMLGNQRHLIAKTNSGALEFFDTQSTDTAASIASLSFFNEGADYILQTANNQFDASPAMQRNGYLIEQSRLVPLNTIFAQNYEPNLLERMLEGVAINDTAPEPFVLAPEVSLRGKMVNALRYSLNLYGGRTQYPLDSLSLFQNGKLVKTFQSKNPDRLLIEDFEIDLLLESNTFTLVASDTQGTSRTSEPFTIEPPRAAVEAAKRKQDASRLHMLVVGINQYKNTEQNLNYAVADAQSALQAFREGNQALFDQIETIQLIDDAADHAGILKAFETITKDANPQDAFIFYYAGHGVMSEVDQNFYLVPYDVTQIYGPSQILTSKGISSHRLRQLSEGIRAQKQLFILDACNSGGALEAFTQRGASQEKAIAQLARSTGTHWIAASSSTQFATEFASLGHGAFTYTLLKALSGEADSGDRRITINELKAYLESELPSVTKEHKGRSQYPASFGYGQDFPVALLP